jgi:4-hydroxy-tetrahydrodipicolinate reductase
MKVLIVGYGNMGREIEAVLLRRGHSVTARIDPAREDADAPECTTAMAAEADTAIEFALSAGVPANARLYAEHGLSAVVGTTGWEDTRDEVKRLVEEKGTIGYIWGANFSIGAHILFALTEKAARMVDKLPDYDIMAYELHHRKKKDSPSGTALRIGEGILKNTDRKKRIVTEKLDRRIEADELHIASVRGGSIPGIHTVLLDSPADTIEVRHTARNRSGFALGAVLAAEWVADKQGFFQVEDFIQDFF